MEFEAIMGTEHRKFKIPDGVLFDKEKLKRYIRKQQNKK